VQPPADDRSWIEPLSSTQVIALILGLTIGVVLIWAVPILAIPLAWPWLFLVPGWVVVRRIAPDLPAPAQIGVGVVTSTYVSAHLVEVVATVGGFGRAAVLVSIGLLVLATAIVVRLRHRWLAPWSMPSLRALPGSIGASLGTMHPRGSWPPPSASWSHRCLARMDGERHQTGSCRAAGTGAT
jgi:hypothetical protein